MKVRHERLVLLAMIGMVACGKDAGGAISVRDSSGVAIVEHDSTALAAAPVFTPGEPLLTMGGENADSMHNVTAMRSAVMVEGTRFVMLDGRANRVIGFDSTGAVYGSWGSKGDGAGQLAAPAGLRWIRGGIIQVVDFPARVVQLNAPDLSLIREATVGPADPIFAVVLHQTGPGTALVVESQAVQGGVGVQNLLRVRRTGVDTITSWPGSDPSRFGRQAIARAWGDNIVVGGNGWHFSVRDTAGKLIREVSLRSPSRAVTPAMRDSTIARERRQLEGLGVDKASIEDALKTLSEQKFADSVAAFDDMFESHGGELWVSEYLVNGDVDHFYTVFDTEGKLIRRVKVPANQKVLAADGDLVLVRWSDDKTKVGTLQLVRLKAAPAVKP